MTNDELIKVAEHFGLEHTVRSGTVFVGKGTVWTPFNERSHFPLFKMYQEYVEQC